MRYVQIPHIKPAIIVSAFFAIIGALQVFDVIIPLTNGGPSNQTHTIVTYLYTFGLTRLNIGFGSAVGVILFFAAITVAVFYQRFFMRRDRRMTRGQLIRNFAARRRSCCIVASFVLAPHARHRARRVQDECRDPDLAFALPESWNCEFYGSIVADPAFWRYLGNSLMISIGGGDPDPASSGRPRPMSLRRSGSSARGCSSRTFCSG